MTAPYFYKLGDGGNITTYSSPRKERFDFSDQHIDPGYYIQASAVYSSNIEGNTIDLNSFMNYRLSRDMSGSNKEIKEIENLINAYQFAQNNALDEDNFLECHRILSETLLIPSKRGRYRIEPVGVFGESGLVYLAIEPELVRGRMRLFIIKIIRRSIMIIYTLV